MRKRVCVVKPRLQLPDLSGGFVNMITQIKNTKEHRRENCLLEITICQDTELSKTFEKLESCREKFIDPYFVFFWEFCLKNKFFGIFVLFLKFSFLKYFCELKILLISKNPPVHEDRTNCASAEYRNSLKYKTVEFDSEDELHPIITNSEFLQMNEEQCMKFRSDVIDARFGYFRVCEEKNTLFISATRKKKFEIYLSKSINF